MPLLLIGVDGMFVTQCFAEIDRRFKGDFSEPESDRSKLFLQRMLLLVCLTFFASCEVCSTQTVCMLLLRRTLAYVLLVVAVSKHVWVYDTI